MKRLLAAVVLALAWSLSAADVPDELFISIPANPDFVFAKGLNSRSGGAGEVSPISKPYCIARYPVTNAGSIRPSAKPRDTGLRAAGKTGPSRKEKKNTLF